MTYLQPSVADWRAVCVPAGGAAESSAEGEERAAVQDGGGPGGPQRADEETQGRRGPGLLSTLSLVHILQLWLGIVQIFSVPIPIA